MPDVPGKTIPPDAEYLSEASYIRATAPEPAETAASKPKVDKLALIRKL